MAKKPAKKSEVLSSTIYSLNKRILPSSATLYGCAWDNRSSDIEPLTIEEKTVRGVMSHHIAKAVASDPLKLQREVEKANIQTVDHCALAPEHDTLVSKFTVNFLPVAEGLEASNNPEYAERIAKFIEDYAEEFGFKVLAERYAFNLASGRHLWKNKVGAERVEVTVSYKPFESDDTASWTFNAFNVGTLESPSDELKEFAQSIAAALRGDLPFALFEITSAAKRGFGQDVYPSQEFVQAKNDNKAAKAKVLCSVNGTAGIHDQKIGNAIRSIDTWYPEASEFNRAIPIEVYGAVTNLSKAFRAPATGADYHSVAKKLVAGEAVTVEEKHYLIAMFIRGGVLGTEK